MRTCRLTPSFHGRLWATGLSLLVALASACSESGDDGDGIPIEGLEEYDPLTTIRRGPYLQAPGPSTMTICWETDLPSTSRVEYGAGPQYGQNASGIVYQQEPSMEEDVYAGVLPTGYQHEVVLEGLQPGATVHYRVLSAPEPTADATFTVLPESGQPFNFVVFGDTRSHAEDHALVIAAIMLEASDSVFAIHTGDLVSVGGVEAQWDEFFAIEAPLVRQIPLMAAFGNHELAGGRTLFEAAFKAPPTSTSTSDLHYSFDVGPIHVAVIDPYELDFDPHEDWLAEDLDSSTARYKFLVTHAPLFTFSNHAPAVDLREWLVPLCESTGVQAVFMGHNHLYERFFGHGIQFVVTGGGGAPLYDADDNLDYPNEGADRMAADSSLHLVRARFDGNQVRFEAIKAATLETIDCFVVDDQQPGQDLVCP